MNRQGQKASALFGKGYLLPTATPISALAFLLGGEMGKPSKHVTQDAVQKLFSYHEDGYLIWRVMPNSMGRVMPGDRAGYTTDRGYRMICTNRTQYLEHRIIFLWHYGFMPKEIDHINRNRSDNRIENLRPCTRSQNKANSVQGPRARSGYRGVERYKGRWRVKISVNGRSRYLGTFDDAKEAARAYDSAANKVHGPFAVLNFPQS